ncbi:MAG: winged helix-turn-helix transcriptional regulator [Lentisphaerota bacterium]
MVESQQQISRLVIENPHIFKRDMAKHIGISATAIDKNIETLKSKGLLKRIGSDKTGHWEIRVVENRKIIACSTVFVRI